MGTSVAEVVARQVDPVGGSTASHRNPALVYLARLATGSRPTMADALNTIAGMLTGGRVAATEINWSTITYAEAQAVRTRLAEELAPATANKILSALRGVVREAWRLGQIDGETYYRIKDVESVKGRTLPSGRALSAGEIRALFDACRSDRWPAAGCRDAAMIALLYAGGLRRSEVVALDLDDYGRETGEVRIRRAKGNRDRLVYCSAGAQAALGDWLAHRGPAPGPLFSRVSQGGRVVPGRPSNDVVWHVVRKRAQQAGIPPVGPHSLRRSFITHLMEAGADVGTVQRLAGHANVQTTLRYDRRGESAKKQAASLLHVPWPAP